MTEQIKILLNINQEISPLPNIEDIIQCSICYEEIYPCELIALLNCKHYFHYKCIRKWNRHHNSCPICREEVICNELNLSFNSDTSNDEESGRNNYRLLEALSRRTQRSQRIFKICRIFITFYIILNLIVLTLILVMRLAESIIFLNTTNIEYND